MIFKIIIIFLILFSKDVHTENLIDTNEFIKSNSPERDLDEFFKLFKEVCKEKLFENLEKHPSYPSLGTKNQWKTACEKLKKENLNWSFILQNFKVKKLSDKEGVLTGYYEPEINVSFKRTEKFSVPILKYNKVYDNLDREKIESNFKIQDVLLWTDSKIELFFLQIQGSGIGSLGKKKEN